MPIRPEMRKRYPKDWKLRSRFVRFVRAKGKCEWCSVPHGWYVWRHPENFKSWFARDCIDGGIYLTRVTCSGTPLDPPINFTGPTRIVLTTAHVFDHRPEAASLLNLAALCQKCHNAHDAQMRQAGIRERRHEGQQRLFA